MNMDDFLTNIWTAEQVNNNVPAATVNNDVVSTGVSDLVSITDGSAAVQPVYTQGMPLCKKTADEVWSELNRDNLASEEMTLEDFLVKAGVVRDNRGCAPPPPCPSSSSYGDQTPLPITTVSPLSSDGLGLPANRMLEEVTRSGMRKRALDGPVVDRRQRRMIKNRESAARSRSRKQAYTVELEAEVNNLNQENAHVIEEHKILVARRRQMVLESLSERMNRANSAKKSTLLRRCITCLW